MNTTRFMPNMNARGASLVEVLVGIVVLTITLLGLSGATALGFRQTYRGRMEMQEWAAVQRVVDSLVVVTADSAGWVNVAAGSDTLQGYALNWTVSGADPKQINLIVEPPSATALSRADTLVLYVSNPTP